MNQLATSHAHPRNQFDYWTGVICCLLASAFAAWIFGLEWNHPTSHMSDVTFHLSILRAIDATVRSGGNPVDFWYDTSPFGFALFRGYQHLPHLILYTVFRLLGSDIPLETILRVATCLLATLTPWAFYWGARLLKFSSLAAGLAGLFSVLLVEKGNYGLGLHNYNWGSGGIIAQLWAVNFLVPAIGAAVQFIQSRKGLGLAVFLGFCTFGSHVLAIFILGISVALFACIGLVVQRTDGDTRKKFLLRSTLYFSALLAVTTHQWLFTLLDGPYLLGSIHEPRWKFESYGTKWVLNSFADGSLFDVGRFPGLTAFVLIGLVFCVLRPQQLAKVTEGTSAITTLRILAWWLVASFLFNLSLFFGWDAWGWTIDYLHLLSSLHWHRFVVGAHVFGLLLAAIGVSILLTASKRRIIPLLLLAACLFPLISDRVTYFVRAKSWFIEALEAQRQDANVQSLVTDLHDRPRGRIFTGLRSSWADELKIGQNLALHNVLLGEGLPTNGILYYPMSLAGDVMFDVSINRPAQRQALGLRYAVIPPNQPLPQGLVELSKYGKYGLYADPEAGMLNVVSIGFTLNVKPSDLPRAMRSWFQSQLVEQKIYGAISIYSNQQSIGKTVDAFAGLPAMSSPSIGRVLSESPWVASSVSGTVQLQTQGYVLAKIPYHPNWNATVDQTTVRPIWVTPGFMAIPCEAGTHNVHFSYRGSPYKLVLFIAGLFFCLALLAYDKFSVPYKNLKVKSSRLPLG